MENTFRLEALKALKFLLDNRLEIINLIYESKNEEECKKQLQSKYNFTDWQAQVIIDCQIKWLCEYDRNQLDKEIEELNNNLV